MTDFEYLSVLVSIVLGLGITNILGGLGGMVRHRDRMKFYSPVMFTLVTLFLIHGSRLALRYAPLGRDDNGVLL